MFLTIYIIDYHAVQRTNLPTYTTFIVQKQHKSSLTTDSLQKVGISNSLKPFMVVYYSYYTLFFSIFKLSRPRTLNCIGQECQSFIVCFPEFFLNYKRCTVGSRVVTHVTDQTINFSSKTHSMYIRIEIPFISNLKKPACTSKQDVLELATFSVYFFANYQHTYSS